MMRPKQVTITASGKSTPIPLDRYVNGYALAVISSGSVYTLQYSLSDPYDTYTNSYAVSGVWFDCDDALLVNASTNRSTNFAFPPRAVRLNVSANVSAGRPVVLQIVPMGAM